MKIIKGHHVGHKIERNKANIVQKMTKYYVKKKKKITHNLPVNFVAQIFSFKNEKYMKIYLEVIALLHAFVTYFPSYPLYIFRNAYAACH